MTAQTLWDTLEERLQKKWAGNTDPWLGPVDPEAQARELEEWKRTRNPRLARMDHAASTCACGMNDCAYCGALRADGHRVDAGAFDRFWRAAR